MSIGSQAREQTLLRGVAMVATAAVVGGLAWSAGFVALREALHSPFGRPFSDVGAAFWIAFPFAFAVPVVHVQFVLWIRDRVTTGATIKLLAAAAGGALVAIIPIGLDLALFGTSSDIVVMSSVFNVAASIVFCVALTAILAAVRGVDLHV